MHSSRPQCPIVSINVRMDTKNCVKFETNKLVRKSRRELNIWLWSQPKLLYEKSVGRVV